MAFCAARRLFDEAVVQRKKGAPEEAPSLVRVIILNSVLDQLDHYYNCPVSPPSE